MGARGSSGGISRATQAQKRIMSNISKSVQKNPENSDLSFKMLKNGDVEFTYTETRTITHVHGSKMQSEEKNDILKRVSVYHGTIGKDGLWRKNRKSKTETLIKKGKSR